MADESPLLSEIKQTYFRLDDDFDEIYAACKTDDQRAALRSLHASARDAFWKAVAEILDDHNPFVMSIYNDLKKSNTSIKKMLDNLKDIVAFLKLATEAVRLAAALATLAAAA